MQNAGVVARRLILGICAGALAAPALVVLGGPSTPEAVAQPACSGGINMTILQDGAPVSTPCPGGPIPVTSGGAPTQGILSQCSGIPGCLSSVLYGPGTVQVPQRDTTVRQSQ